MKKFLAILLVLATIILCGCGRDKSVSPSPERIELPKITSEFAEKKIMELEKGLDVQHDEMKGITFYTCPIYFGQKVCIAPYVSVADDDYSTELFCHVVYSGHERIDFDTLYIKTAGELKTFYFDDVYRMYHAGYYGDEYNGVMPANLYFTLKKVVGTGSARVRLEGINFSERDLLPKEIEHMKKVFAIYELLNGVEVEQ
ncbi:MAG: hypothetical protein IKP64_10815 [Selenomonadaceae bacterium]|nr:hypothetical protein [Selenomonadaceae bacterium]